MTDDLLAVKSAKKPRGKGKPFKPGYDPRRWLSGRGKKSPEQKKGEQILLTVIWEELSRELDGQTGKLTEQPEVVDTLRVMVRNLIKRKPEVIADRIAGKVTERHDVTTGGERTNKITVEYVDSASEVTQSADSDQDEPQEV